jgi:hypothetical protein
MATAAGQGVVTDVPLVQIYSACSYNSAVVKLKYNFFLNVLRLGFLFSRVFPSLIFQNRKQRFGKYA